MHKCKICSHEWLVRPTTLVSSNPRGCPHCAAVKAGKARASYTTTTFKKRLAEVHESLELSGEYPGPHELATFRCLRRNHEWKARPYSILQGHGCPKCVKTGTSFMEQVFLGALRCCLGKIKVLSRDRAAIGQEIDIYIPSMHIAFEPGSWALHQQRLQKDSEKRALCKNAGIRLVFIYDKFPASSEKPFDVDCFTYPGDFNKDDHSNLWEMVESIFNLIDLKADFSLGEILRIEAEAYEASKALTHDLFVSRMASLHPTIRVIGKYVNTNKRVECTCVVCGRHWMAVPANLLSGDGCWDCARKQIGKKQRMPVSDYVAKLREANPDITIDESTFKGTHGTVKATCSKCGRAWEPLARTLIRKNPCRCSYCNKKRRIKEAASEYIVKLAVTKPFIECLEPYKNRSEKILHRCKICGYEWYSAPRICAQMHSRMS